MTPDPGARESAEGLAPTDSAAPGPSGAAESWWGEASVRAVLGGILFAVGAAMVGGVLLGYVWLMLSPPVQAAFGSRLSEAQLDRVFGAEAIFAAVMVVAGVVSAALSGRWLRRAGPFAVVGVVLAGLVGSVVAWRVGLLAGPEPIDTRTGLTAGDAVQLPLVLRSYGLLLVWPISAVFVTLWIATLSPDSRLVATVGSAQLTTPDSTGAAPRRVGSGYDTDAFRSEVTDDGTTSTTDADTANAGTPKAATADAGVATPGRATSAPTT